MDDDGTAYQWDSIQRRFLEMGSQPAVAAYGVEDMTFAVEADVIPPIPERPQVPYCATIHQLSKRVHILHIVIDHIQYDRYRQKIYLHRFPPQSTTYCSLLYLIFHIIETLLSAAYRMTTMRVMRKVLGRSASSAQGLISASWQMLSRGKRRKLSG